MGGYRRKAPVIKSLKEVLADNRKGLAYYEAMSGKKTPQSTELNISSAPIFKSGKSVAKKDAPLENVIKNDVMKYLRLHPKVAWRCRINSGTVQIGKSWVQFNTQPGISDIIGMFKAGRFFAIETKRIGEKPTPDQQDYIDMINTGGGLAFWSDNMDEVIEKINSA